MTTVRLQQLLSYVRRLIAQHPVPDEKRNQKNDLAVVSGADGTSARRMRPWIRTIHTLCEDYSLVVIFSFTGSIPRRDIKLGRGLVMTYIQDVSKNDTALPHLSPIQCLQYINHLVACLWMMFDGCHNRTCCSGPHAQIVVTRPTFVSHSGRTQCEPNKRVTHQESKDISSRNPSGTPNPLYSHG